MQQDQKISEVRTIDPKKSVISRFAANYGVDQDKVIQTLKNTAFRVKNGEVTNEQMMALLIVAEQHKLNPFTREIYAFPDKQNGIIPVVGVDGWSRIINEKPTFNGMQFRESENILELPDAKRCPEWIECSIFDSKREYPVSAKEYLDEVYRPPFEGTGKDGKYKVNGPWQTHTKRMLRHKAMIQCARMAYGFSGFFDPDEAERIIEAEVVEDFGPVEKSSNHRFKPGEKEEIYTQVKAALLSGDGVAIKQIQNEYRSSETEQMKFWGLFNSEQRRAIKDLTEDL